MTQATQIRTADDEGGEAARVLARLHEAGRTAHPGIELPADAFARGARDRAAWTAEDDGGSVGDALAAMERRGRAGDLFLVLACEAGGAEAWRRLCDAFLPAVARALAAQGVGPAQADAAAAELPGHLVQPPRHGRSRTRLGGYRAVAGLTTFLCAAALALRTSAYRVRSATPLEEAVRAGALAPEEAPPAAARLEDAEAASRLAALLPAAWARLTAQESLALLFLCRDRLPQRTIASLLGVGPPRVSRIVDRAHSRLREALAGAPSRADAFAGVSPDALRGVVEQFLATSFPDVRPAWERSSPLRSLDGDR